MQMLSAAEVISGIEKINALELESGEAVNIDFADVENVSFDELNTLLKLQKTAILNNRQLFISGANSKIKQLLDLTGFSSVLSQCAGQEKQEK